MVVPDLNLLLYAYFSVFPMHVRAKSWWEGLVESGEPIGLAPPVLFGFVRISTQRRVFASPLDLAGALAIVETWLALPDLRVLRPSPNHVRSVLDLLAAVGVSRDLTTDAQIAAYALENQAVVHSVDAGFLRFPGVRIIDPLVP